MNAILFIGHDANRAGAQYLLLHLLTYLRETGVRTGLVLGEGGPLLPDYEQVTTVYQAFSSTKDPSFGARILSKLGMAPSASGHEIDGLPNLIAAIRAGQYSYIVSNTIANGRLLRMLEPLNLPFAMYVHELETSIQIYTRPEDLQYELTHVSHVFCGSEAVRQNLIDHHGLTPDNTSVLNSLIRTATLIDKLKAVDQESVRKRLGIPSKAVVVGGCGNAEWRKGVDLFLLIARQLLNARPEVHFVWVGIPETGEDTRRLRYDLARMDMANRVHLLPPGGDYLDYVACFDLFTLTSREDPYPLVILEAGLNQNPVLCFAGSGGSPDFVGTDTGCLVPYLDLSAMVTALARLTDDPAERTRLGNLFYERAMAHDVAALVPKLLAKLDAVFLPLTPDQYVGR
ncbi:glycosyltransferase family 4 protein [Spirosoma spitsbergense]|uniref:glycosyltransferase family 4 protein n=1 Tax=Spirosoma spitsbergense TaxID=431554 RepID=UPI000361C835|nr:glycosyltransferase family 4 protein [Spirosoma spitsbergense]